MTPDAAADAFYAAYNAHDAEAAAALYRPDGWHEEVHSGKRRQGRPDLTTGLVSFFRLIPDVVWTERERLRAGRSIALLYTMTGTVAADIGPYQAAGRTITLPGLHVLEVDDDGLSASRDVWDMADFIRQIS